MESLPYADQWTDPHTSTRSLYSESALVNLSIAELGINRYSIARETNNNSWILDSVATNHMTFDDTDFVQTSRPQFKFIANSSGLQFPQDLRSD